MDEGNKVSWFLLWPPEVLCAAARAASNTTGRPNGVSGLYWAYYSTFFAFCQVSLAIELWSSSKRAKIVGLF